MEKEEKKEQERNYHSPDFEVVEIEFEQNVLQAGSGNMPDYDAEDY